MKKYTVFFFILILSAPPIAFAESDDDNAENNFHQGAIQWIDKCITIASGTSIVRVTDHDMNKDPTKMEHFDIEMGSDSDRREKSMTVAETGKDTGIFEGTVFFFTNDDDGSSHRVRISVGDTVFARYVDENPVKYSIDNKPTDNSDMILFAEIPVLEPLNNKKHTIEYGPCTISYVETVKKTHSPKLEVFYPAPLKQVESGLSLDEIRCKDNLELVLRYDGSPACVKPESIPKLHERGWLHNEEFQVIELGSIDFSKYHMAETRTAGTHPLGTEDGEKFDISYSINGANISEIIYDVDANSIIISLKNVTSDGELVITIPRELFIPKINEEHNYDDDDADVFVLLNGEEVDFDEIHANNTEMKLSILFEKESDEIEIISSNVFWR